MWGALEGCAAAVSGWRLLCVSIAFTSERKFRSLSSMVLMTIWRNQKGDMGIFKGENGNFVGEKRWGTSRRRSVKAFERPLPLPSMRLSTTTTDIQVQCRDPRGFE